MSVEVVAGVARHDGACGIGDAACWVERVAEEWVTGGGEVDADLVGATGGDGGVEEGGIWPVFDDGAGAVGREGFWVIWGGTSVNVAESMVREFADGVGAGEAIGELSGDGGADEGSVDFSERLGVFWRVEGGALGGAAGAELAGEVGAGGLGFGDEDGSGGAPA